MKILMINHHRWSRSNHRAGALAKLLVRQGHEVTLMVVADYERWRFVRHRWNGVDVVESPDLFSGRLRSGWDPICALRRKYWLKKNESDFDLIHLFETRPATIYPGLYIKKKLGIPLIIDWIDWWGRGGLIEVNRPRWYRILFEKFETFFEEHYRIYADGTSVISHGLAKRAIGLGVKQNTILHLRPGIDFERFEDISINESRKILQLPQDIFLIGFGSQDSFLDMEPFLSGVSKLLEKGIDINLLLLGSIQTAAKGLLKKYKLEKNIITPGFVSDGEYPIYLSACDVFGMPFPHTNYNIGRWPNKFGEYLASGRPIVFNPVGDLSEFVVEKAPGIVCEFDAESFKDAFEELYKSKDTRIKLGSQAREIAVHKFSWERCISKLEVLYTKLIEDKKGEIL